LLARYSGQHAPCLAGQSVSWRGGQAALQEGGIEFTNGDEPDVKLTAKKGKAKR
jgi:hypothetical protein